MSGASKPAFTPRRFGKYLLLDRIGRGGMAEVFRAKTFGAAGFVKESAIKKILTSLLDDDQFVRMFVDEAKLTAYLTHPNIVQVLDLGEIGGHLFIAMEYVSGKDLLDVLARSARRGIRIPVELALHITVEMLKGLDFAHKAKDASGDPMNIVHRDVSPSNILLSYDGQVKVGDFGIAKSQMQSSKTEVGTQKGKTGYMSPEQVTGAEIDRRSDLFAAAVILFEMITMTRLFKAKNDLEVMLKIRDSNIAEDLERARKISPQLADLIAKGLRKDPDDRYRSGAEFIEALKDYIQEEKIKTSAASLSAYVSELFSDKVENEREKRKADPSHDSGFQTIADAKESLLRYKDAEGAIHGPMRAAMMEEMLGSRVPADAEQISFDGGPWTHPADFAEFTDVERPVPIDEVRPASVSGSGYALRVEHGADWEDLSLAGINPRARRRRTNSPSGESGAMARRDSQAPRDVSTAPDSFAASRAADFTPTGRVTTATEDGRRSDSATASGGYSEIQQVVENKRRASALAKAGARASVSIDNASLADSGGITCLPGEPSTSVRGRNQSISPSGVRTRVDSRAGSGTLRRTVTSISPRAASSRSPRRLTSSSRSTSGALPSATALTSPAANSRERTVLERTRRTTAESARVPDLLGAIGKISVFRLIHGVTEGRATGRLRLKHDGVKKDIYLDSGTPVAIDSSDPEDRLLAVLYRAEQVSEEELHKLAAEADERGVALEDYIATSGIMPPHTLFHYLQEQLAEKLMGTFFWEDGDWAWWEESSVDRDGFPLAIRATDLLARGVNEQADIRYLRVFFKERQKTALIPLVGMTDLATTKLSPKAMRLYSNVQEGVTLGSLVRLFADRYQWTDADVYRTLYWLTERGIIGYEGVEIPKLPGE
jgi:serine/threonine protein kinase